MLTDAAVKKAQADEGAPKGSRRPRPLSHRPAHRVEVLGPPLSPQRPACPKLTLGSCDTTGKELEGDPAIGGHLMLVAARRLNAEVKRQLALGKDVIAERKAVKLHRVVAARDAEQNTYIAAARDYVEREQRGRKKNRRLAQRRRPSRSRLSRWRRRADNHPRQPRRALGRPAGDRDNKRRRVCCAGTRDASAASPAAKSGTSGRLRRGLGNCPAPYPQCLGGCEGSAGSRLTPALGWNGQRGRSGASAS